MTRGNKRALKDPPQAMLGNLLLKGGANHGLYDLSKILSDAPACWLAEADHKRLPNYS
jgi:hypothetical protein